MTIKNPYHEGELTVQQRAGQIEMARTNAGVIRKKIPSGALRFIEQQPMIVIGSMDAQGQVWASALFGEPGFVRALNDHTLELDISQPRSAQDDPLWGNLLENPNVGFLVIELGTRRRIRINGRARKISGEHILIDVDRAYANCPKYIQRRNWETRDVSEQIEATTSTFGHKLRESQKGLIAGADTLFVASAHPRYGIDVSHRGGHPGFAQILPSQQLRIPDFRGNSMFNTLGNFTSYPHAGLIFIDFEHDRLFQLSGRPEILWDFDDPQGETGGTSRYWQFDITSWQESTPPHHFDWELLDNSPHIPELQRICGFDETLSLQVERIQEETDRVKSFRLRAPDRKELPEFQSGAHLQVKVKLSDGSEAQRHYSLLNSPDDRTSYEIAVLKAPEMSGGSFYLHDHVREGDRLEIRIPKNEFLMSGSANHSILIAGGIGITPILSMMQSLSSKNESFEVHYSARTFSELAFRQRIEQLLGDRANFYASREPNVRRLDLKELLSTPKPGTHVYVCGPRSMINTVREITALEGWDLSQIHFESFGYRPLVDDKEIRVHLAKSNRTITIAADRSILDTLLDADVDVPHDCKRGECAMCTTRVLNGEPDHRDLCLDSEDRASSMCICVSRAMGQELLLDL